MFFEILCLILFIGAIFFFSEKGSRKNSNNRSSGYFSDNDIDRNTRELNEFKSLKVVGTSYNNEIGGSRKNIVSKLNNGELVFAMCDYNNSHHSSAVRIVSSYGCIGFIPRPLIDKYGPENYAKKSYEIVIEKELESSVVFLKEYDKSLKKIHFNGISYISFNKGCLTLIGRNIINNFKINDILLRHFKFNFGIVTDVSSRIINGAYYNVIHPDNEPENQIKKYSYDIFISELISEVYIREDRYDYYKSLMVESYEELNKKDITKYGKYTSSYADDYLNFDYNDDYSYHGFHSEIDTDIDEGYAEDIEWENRY